MGVNNLNLLLQHANLHSTMIKRIVIDGSNLLILSIMSASSFCKENRTLPTNLYTEYEEIMNLVINKLKHNLNNYLKIDSVEEIIFVTDNPNETPLYKTNSGLKYAIKQDEQEHRKKTMSKRKSDELKDKLQKIKETNPEHYESYEEFYNMCMSTYSQYLHFDEVSNCIHMIGYIKNKLMQEYKDEKRIKFVQAISEADFVIKNIVNESEEPSLVLSKDTDYCVLLSDLHQAYYSSNFNLSTETISVVDEIIFNEPPKKEMTFKLNDQTVVEELTIVSSLLHPYSLWKELIHEDLNYKLVCCLALTLGNDYTLHSSIITLNKTKDNIELVKGLFNVDDTFDSVIMKSRMRKIKGLITFVPEGILTEQQFRIMFDNVSTTMYSIALEVFDSWTLNNEYKVEEVDQDKDFKQECLDNILKQYNIIYTVTPNNLNIIHELINSETNIEEVMTKHSIMEGGDFIKAEGIIQEESLFDSED